MKVYVLLSALFGLSLALTDVTNKVFGGDNIGTIAAFGDFNADKHVDVFVISEDGMSVYVYLASLESQFDSILLLDNKTLDGAKISSIVPADFDGDLQMDLLVATGNPPSVSLKIFWGNIANLALDTKNPFVPKSPVTDQPLLLDENGDMIPDLLVEKKSGERYYWLFSKHRNYTEKLQISGDKAGTHPPMRVPQSSAFVDLNNDLTADLCIVSTDEDSKVQLEFWLNKAGVLTQDGDPVKVEFEGKTPSLVGQFTFVDLDGDLITDILVPVCMDSDCVESMILLYYNKNWVRLRVSLEFAGMMWSFIPPSKTPAPGGLHIPMALRVGDFNMDGYPDLLAVLGNATGTIQRAVILENVACGDGCGGFSRTFAADWNRWLEDRHHKAVVPAFYDLYENGILDVIVSSVDNQGQSRIAVHQQKSVGDTCFMKVTVVSGLCNYDCPGGRQPYGVNQPGPVIRYETTDLEGNDQHRIATQLTQSAYFPLQLPYTIFGLGQTPNFVDKLIVGIPTNTSTRLHKDWNSVIPNSQLVIIPYPINDPSRWTNKLFVTPSRLMLLTGASLLGTCGFIAGIVSILHWRDKVEDKKEKRQESQRFHFDAM